MHQLNCPRVITAHQANILWLPTYPPPPLPLLLLSFIVYGCAGEPHGKRFCAFSCLVYTPRAHEYAMVSAPCHAPLAHLVACSTIAKLKSKNIRCEVCIKLGTQKSLQRMEAGERKGA